MKTFLAIFILFIGSVLVKGESAEFTDVYICKGPYSKKYHYTSTCSGLSNCSTSIYQVTLNEAEDLGRTLCGLED